MPVLNTSTRLISCQNLHKVRVDAMDSVVLFKWTLINQRNKLNIFHLNIYLEISNVPQAWIIDQGLHII